MTKGLIGLALLAVLLVGGVVVLSADDDFNSACQSIEGQENKVTGTIITSEQATAICACIKKSFDRQRNEGDGIKTLEEDYVKLANSDRNVNPLSIYAIPRISGMCVLEVSGPLLKP